MNQIAKKPVARTYKLLIAGTALALGLTLAPSSASAGETRVEVTKRYEYSSNRSRRPQYRSQRHYDRRGYDRRGYDRRGYDRRYPSSRRYDHRSHRSYRDRDDYYRPRYRSSYRFSIPHRLIENQLHALSHFFLGSFYYPEHHHYHRVYDFPVYVGGRVTYRTYAYCQGELYDQPYDDSEYDYDYDSGYDYD